MKGRASDCGSYPAAEPPFPLAICNSRCMLCSQEFKGILRDSEIGRNAGPGVADVQKVQSEG